MKSLILALAVALAAATPAAAQNRSFDPRAYQRQHVGEPTQVLVLGAMHLSETPDSFDPAVLEPLLDRLAAFRPDAITIEALPGIHVASMWQYRQSFPDVASTYGNRAMMMAGLARAGVDLDMPDAEAEVRRTLAEWPASPTPAQRRRLAALFAASGDHNSALVQWWRLDPAERIADDNVTALLAAQFAAYDTRRNENHLIAARLAARLGLERVFPVDDQSDDAGPGFMEDFEPYVTPLYEAQREDPRAASLMQAGQRMTTPAEALATFRSLNTPAAGQFNADWQWLPMINRPSPRDVGRRRVASWEVRNMRMVANIREVTARHPGGRVLVIVGSSHKPWFDAYLRMMSDVRVVDATAVRR
jgi:hypothetical protein